ncbi:alpha-amylase B-like isoform X2 [Thrips palmi]|uniref:Alpha-amylase n=1 Tax=Thrips palmi TaxID=161013 RepID=A0A6P8ZYV8_THRPL|nr:alpha-amylase B-like isoform X2 [Thrips palmi]
MQSRLLSVLLALLVLLATSWAQRQPNMAPGRSTIVHLFEWKWTDVADECERFLAPKGYGAVQVSPVTENVVVWKDGMRPWWERYQPISYLLQTRSGTEEEFRAMVQRCNKAGVRTYVDVVLNHMTNEHAKPVGTAGSTAQTTQKEFPAVPFHASNFHRSCKLTTYYDANTVRNCEVSGLKDLDHSQEIVRDRQVELLNKLVAMGVAGFRVDAAKHMWPQDLKKIFERVHNLSEEHGFPANTRPFLYQEVIDMGIGEAVSYKEYLGIGRVLDFRYSAEIGRVFGGKDKLCYLRNWGEGWNFAKSSDAVVFVDNHDNQRGHGAGGSNILTHKKKKRYTMAVSFMLAHPHAVKRVMSSFAFVSRDQGPPSSSNGSIVSPTLQRDGSCSSGWMCEHRWTPIHGMVGFGNVVATEPLSNWWDNGNNQIAFCRGSKGFAAFNNEAKDLDQTLQTCLPQGTYCDVVSGGVQGGRCVGKTVTVSADGTARIVIGRGGDGVLAIDVNTRI